MNIFEFAIVDSDFIMKMTESELKDLLKSVQGSINRRYKNTRQSGVESRAAKSMTESGGIISVKNKNLNELRHEVTRAQRFITAKTSTIRGAKKVIEEEVQRLGEKWSRDFTDEDKKKLYEAYNKMINNYIPEETLKEMYGSGQAQRQMAEWISDEPEASVDDLISRFMNEYEKKTRTDEEDDDWLNEDFEEDYDAFDYF